MAAGTSRWIVTGAGGLLGRDVVALLERTHGVDVRGYTHQDLDITDVAGLRREFVGADVVVNCAAWTDVDTAELHEKQARRVNGDGPAHVTVAAANNGAITVHVSTDYVFDGHARTPYPEGTPTHPINAYGRGKEFGEQSVRRIWPEGSYVVRTSWLYGSHGGSFVRSMADRALGYDTVEAVDDQTGAPTWSADVAAAILRLVRARAPFATYHATAAGGATRYELARAVFTELGADPDRIRPVPSSRFPRPAPRPAYTVLGHDRWAAVGVRPIRDWRDALRAAIPELIRDWGSQAGHP
ncbi:MAG: dTDP-4-dehydrorhamnose reductase [Actinomycetes bacterium]